MIFDPTVLDHAALVETNRRLNARCQKAEHQATKWRRRYATIQKPLHYALEGAVHATHQIERIWKEEHRAMYWGSTSCPWCRLRWWLKKTVRAW